jgi:hypothetical protein
LKSPNLKKLLGREKNLIGGLKNFLPHASPPLQNERSIFDNISLFYNFVKHYISLFLQKEAIFFFVKGLFMLKVQSIENLPKTLPRFIEKFLFKFFTIEMDFEK